MKNLVLYAPPAAGKGTLCEYLISRGYSVLSIGQVLRDARSTETEIGRKIIETQDKGILTPDDIVLEALKNELKKYEGDIAIDGYPRNISQAKMLDTIFSDYEVINLDVPKEIAMKRTLGRQTCPKCGKIYNKYFETMAPKVEDICDACGEKLSSRSDDNEQSFMNRFGVYETNSPEILSYYKEKNILHVVDANQDVKDIINQVNEILGD